jgi:hypothetical protein
MGIENTYIEKYYLPLAEAKHIGDLIGGGATYVFPQELEQKVSPLYEFLKHASSFINAAKSDIKDGFEIYLVAFYSQNPSCFAKKISNSRYVIAVSDAQLILNAHYACHLLAIKEVREFLGTEDGNFLTSIDDDVKDVWELPIDEVTKNLYASYPIWLCANQFIAFHEARHIMNGHLNFLELSDNEYLSDENLSVTRKSLEVDADCSALGLMRNYLIDNKSIFPGVDFENFSKLLEYCHLILSSVFSTTNLDDLFDEKISEKGLFHPEQFTRFNYLMSSLYTWKDQKSNYVPTGKVSIIQITNSLFLSRSKDKDNVIKKWSDKDVYWEYWNKNMDYVKSLEMRWNKIRPFLVDIKPRISDIAPENPWA